MNILDCGLSCVTIRGEVGYMYVTEGVDGVTWALRVKLGLIGCLFLIVVRADIVTNGLPEFNQVDCLVGTL